MPSCLKSSQCQNRPVSARPLSRRTFLRGVGVALALPMLDAMRPAMSFGETGAPATADATPPRRMLCICTNMGMMPQFFFPEGEGPQYKPSPYLELIDAHRQDFTVFSGLSHPQVDGGHHAEVSFLTGAVHPGSGGFRNSISLDQFAAEQIGIRTRFPSLTLDVGMEDKAGLSYTGGGIMIPADRKPSDVFKRLFVQGTADEIEAQVDRLREGRSVLDAVSDRAKGLQRDLGARDRDKLDQYFTSVREFERRLVRAEEWEHKPVPKVDVPIPVDITDPGELVGRTRLMFDIARLALQTDSTRTITLKIDENTNPKPNIPGVTHGHHTLTHHGNREASINELKLIETAQMHVFGELLASLKSTTETGSTLLDSTMVLYGSNLGNAAKHDNHNLPILLAGGGFRHGKHMAFDTTNNYPLANLFVSMLQRMGVETDHFASGKSTLHGLEGVG